MKSEDRMYGAILRGDPTSVRAVLAEDPSVLAIYAVKKTWLHWAAQKGNVEIMQILFNAGLSVDCLTSDGHDTPLYAAAKHGRYAACEWLLDRGAAVNFGLGESATPIFSAIFSGDLEIVKLLCDRGADANAAFGEPRQDVIRYAEVYGTPEIVAYLATANRRES